MPLSRSPVQARPRQEGTSPHLFSTYFYRSVIGKDEELCFIGRAKWMLCASRSKASTSVVVARGRCFNWL
jgi:hypothetical protein